ncbi:hypothetical protein [Sphingomonas oryzagri]
MPRQAADASYFLRRSEEEARKALQTDEPAVAAAHHGLSVRYAAHARVLLNADRTPGIFAFPQFEESGAGFGPISVFPKRLER